MSGQDSSGSKSTAPSAGFIPKWTKRDCFVTGLVVGYLFGLGVMALTTYLVK